MKSKASILIISFFLAATNCYSNDNNNDHISQVDSELDFFAFMLKDAEQGNSESQYIIGGNHSFGVGVLKDHKKAAMWYKKAAKQGHSNAQYALGDAYARGIGVLKDMKQAVEWYIKSAEQGNTNAQQKLPLRMNMDSVLRLI